MKKKLIAIIAAVMVCGIAAVTIVAVHSISTGTIKVQENITSPKSTSSATSSSSGIYAPIPLSRAMNILTYGSGGGQIAIYLNTFKVEGEFDFKNYSKYKKYFPVFYAIQNDTANNKQLGRNGAAKFVTQDGSVKLSFNLSNYKHGSRSWLVPATYKVNVWCQPSEKLDEPTKVAICTFTFQVNEQGFINVNAKDKEGVV